MNKKILYPFCLSFFLLIPRPSLAYLPEVKIYYQHAENTTEEIILDTDDLDYSSDKYYFKIDERLSKPLSFSLNYVDYERDYKVKDELNNRIKDYKNSWDYYFYDENGESLKLDLNLAYRKTDYLVKDRLDFNKTGFNSQLTCKEEGDWSFAIRCGIDNYNFPNAGLNNRIQYYERLGVRKYFYEETAVLTGSAKFKQTDFKEKDDKIDYEVESGIDIKTGHTFLEKISLRGGLGERNTVEDEEYDEEELDFDYRYTSIKVKTIHQLKENLEASIRWEEKDKYYDEVDYNYSSFLIGNGWKYIHNLPGKDKKYLQFKLDLAHSEIEYETREDSSHQKNGVVLKFAYKMRGAWSYSLEFGTSRYNYEVGEKDKDVHYISLAYNRGLFNNNLKLNLEYKYQIKDYISGEKGNTYQHSFLAGCILKF